MYTFFKFLGTNLSGGGGGTSLGPKMGTSVNGGGLTKFSLDGDIEFHTANPDAVWLCPTCDVINFASSFFDSSGNLLSVLNLSNSFESLSSLSDDSDTEIYQSFSRTSSPPKDQAVPTLTLKKFDIGWTVVGKQGKSNPPASSQTNSHQSCKQNSTDKNKTKAAKKPVKGDEIKIAIINCRSIKGKTALLYSFIETADPDILIGSESWLDASIKSAEVFPSHLQIFRKDRNCNRGGGCFYRC